jgi:hypothetical protein
MQFQNSMNLRPFRSTYTELFLFLGVRMKPGYCQLTQPKTIQNRQVEKWKKTISWEHHLTVSAADTM